MNTGLAEIPRMLAPGQVLQDAAESQYRRGRTPSEKLRLNRIELGAPNPPISPLTFRSWEIPRIVAPHFRKTWSPHRHWLTFLGDYGRSVGNAVSDVPKLRSYGPCKFKFRRPQKRG